MSGKIMIPFCTSASSGIGNSATNLQAVTRGNATWIAGQRFAGNTPKSEIERWVQGLDLSKITSATGTPATPMSGNSTQTPSVTQAPNVTPKPGISEQPAATEQPATTGQPTVTEQPTETGQPTVTEQPTETGQPTVTEQPTETEQPIATEQPTATGQPEATQAPDITEAPYGTETPVGTPGPTETPGGSVDKKSIVVYFSCTDNTKTIAEYVKESTESDIYRIEPSVPYTSEDLNYGNDDSRTSKEQNDATARPDIAGSLPDIAEYEIVYLGYPIWWGQAPKILYTFVENCSLSGKTVIPFCTSASSGIGTSATNLQAADTSQATWLAGRRFSGRSPKSDVENWISELGVS